MSKVAIKGNTSGTGTFTLEAPNSNTDRTLTLPDSAGTIATTNGITGADTWRLTSNISLTSAGADQITSNWERDDTYSPALIGSGMSESSGVFTFPETGIWLIQAWIYYEGNSSRYTGAIIRVSVDGSTPSLNGAYVYNSQGGTSYQATPFVSYVFDVTNTSTHKVMLRYEQASTSNTIQGTTDTNATAIQFIRLGDT